MSKEKIELVAILAGVAIFVFIIIGNFKSKPSKIKVAAPPPNQSSPGAQAHTPGVNAQMGPADQQELSLQKEHANMAWSRDPFSHSKAGLEYQRSDLELKGISLGKDKTGFAFINNEIVTTGDKIGGYDVEEVEKTRVLLKKGGQSFYLTLPEE